LNAEIRARIEVGSFVIDEELLTGFVMAGMPPSYMRPRPTESLTD
jgi:hypothetical protein